LIIDTGRDEQRDATGRLRHLLTLDGLTRQEILDLLAAAQGYVRPAGEPPARDPSLAGRTIANLFFEPSTRTRVSFELAAERLGAAVVNLEMQSSSRAKGESVLDTIYTLQAMAVDVFVLRDAEPGLPAWIARHAAPHVSVLNAGEAHLSHPTQGLLDALTIRQRLGDTAQLTVAVVGDVRHSRVARSAWQALSTLGVAEFRIVGPQQLMPDADELPGARRCGSLAEGLAGADVVMALRIQRERVADARIPDAATYHREFGITAKSLALARPGALVMHPGPMNRGVEISDDAADGPQSVIQQQVANGVAVRMAVLASLARRAAAVRSGGARGRSGA
jgi:aspartate carbamoyltransferase catalytic subunit